MKNANQKTRQHQWLRFTTAVSCVVLLWLVVLPWLGRQAQVVEHIQTLQEQRIDPSAMYYSELEILPAIAHRVERLHEYYGYAYEHSE